jgi:hypothetical protein
MLNKKFSNKRGFALQFNWIFVLIAGAVFIGFFISLITNMNEDEVKNELQQSTQEIDALLKVSSAVGDSQKTLPFYKKIVFSCGEISEYSVEGASKPARYDYDVIFSPKELNSKEVIIQTLIFEAPFKVMPLVYVTNKRIEYVFVGTSPIINSLYGMMPANATKKSIPPTPTALSTYPNNNYDQTIFILNETDGDAYLTTTKLSSAFDNKKERAFAVVVSLNQGEVINSYGGLTFYNYTSPKFVKDGDAVLFLDPQTALGGIIGFNKAIYECNARKVIKRLELLTELHEKRLEVYINSYSPEEFSECKNFYLEAKNYVERIRLSSAEKATFTGEDFNNLRLAISDLANLNNQIITSKDCPRIY